MPQFTNRNSIAWGRQQPNRSADQFFNHPAVDVGQAEVAAGVAVGELARGRSPAGAGSWRAGRGRGRGSRRPGSRTRRSRRGRAALHAAAGQPHGEAVVVVVAAVDLAGVGALLRQLDRGRAAELAAPDDQRVVEQPALLEIREQRADRPGRIARPACGGSLRCRRGCPTAGRRRARPARSARRARPAAGRSASAGPACLSPYMSQDVLAARG